ncbi:unnamed protein product [Caenorhabditis auriculariae]|uniref:Uncharacterized protein n=1 Tax=Caenorhabditis auriculariae TaxID=2777116 RepID=A0A8S1H144_9PELO|nr:unnamed protein product [Caenorhabditis auriculariae]
MKRNTGNAGAEATRGGRAGDEGRGVVRQNVADRALSPSVLSFDSDVNKSLIDSPAVSPATLADLTEKVAKMNADKSRAASPAVASQDHGRLGQVTADTLYMSIQENNSEYYTADGMELESDGGSPADAPQGAGRRSNFSILVESLATDSLGPGSPLMASTPIDQSDVPPVIPSVINFDMTLPETEHGSAAGATENDE